MNPTSPTPDDERMIEQVLAGELDLAAAEVQQRLAHDPDLAARLHELLDLAAELTPPSPSAPTGPEPWPGADAEAARMVQQWLGAPPAPIPLPRSMQQPARRKLWPIAAAAAALLAIGVVGYWAMRSLPEAPPGIELETGGGWPAGSVTRQELAEKPWHWPALSSRSPRGIYRIELLDAGGNPIGAPIELDYATSWQPSPELVRTLPDSFLWRVRGQWSGETANPMTFEVKIRP